MIAEIIFISPIDALAELQAGVQQASRLLAAIGATLREPFTRCDDRSTLAKAISRGLGRSNILLTVGGMGRESGFLAKQVMCEGLSLPLEQFPDVLEAIRVYCLSSGESFLAEDSALATLPKGCVPFLPARGKLPGCAISSSKQHIIMLPEAAAELPGMLAGQVLPYLAQTGSATSVVNFVRTYGISHKRVCELLADLTGTANPLVEILAEGPEVLIRVSSHSTGNAQATALATPVLRAIVDRMGDNAYGLNVDSLESAVVQKMQKKSLDIAVAEAGTGGILTRIFSEHQDADGLLRYATTAESTETKISRLGVPAKMLRRQGNVSEYAAVAMADCARRKGEAALGVGICAGYTGAGEGLVYIAVCDAERVYAKKLIIGGEAADYDAVIDTAISRSLNMIRLFVDYLPGPYKGTVALKKALAGYAVTSRARYAEDAAGEPDEGDRTRSLAFLDNFIIRKEDEPSKKVRKFTFILALLVLIGSLGYLAFGFYGSYAARQQAQSLQSLFAESGFDSLVEINPDIVGYLMIDGTAVSYPIVQAADNDHYLRRDFYGGHSNHGIPFMDYRVNVDPPSDNMVIYGHNMKDGQIFGEVLSYSSLDYYAARPSLKFHTPHRSDTYKIIGVFISDAADSAFNYHDFISAESDADMEEFLRQVRLRSLINTTVDAQAGDKLLTLSTCSYEFDSARFVIVARRLRFGESSAVDTAGARLNPQPLYPDIWYATFGGSRPVGATAPVVTSTAVDADASDSDTADSDAERSAAEQAERSANEAAERAAQSASEEAANSASEAAEKAASEAAERAASEKAARSASEAAARLIVEKEAQAIAAEATARQAMDAAQQVVWDLEAAFTLTEAQSKVAEAAQHAETADSAAENARAAAAQAGTEAARQAAEKAGQHADSAFAHAKEAAEVLKEMNEAGRLEQTAARPASGSTGAATIASTAAASATATRGQGGTVLALQVSAGGTRYNDTLDIVSRVVQNEIGGAFHTEAIKAQAVAAYTFIAHSNASGSIPTVSMASRADSRVIEAVREVLGEAVYYNGKLAFTPYHATSAGATTSSRAVWGGSYPYLVSVDSSLEAGLASFTASTAMTSDKVAGLIESKLGIVPDGYPGDWFEILSEADGGYNGNMSVCGHTKSKKTGSTITGRLLREQVLGLRSACFTVDYDDANDRFTFTTYGYGHGVGLSQNGANLYAKQEGWDYIEILEHYYPGTTVQ